MLRAAASCLTALCVVLVVAASSRAQDTNTTPPANGTTQPVAAQPAQPAPPKETLSPLHAFLGIDPVTGEFKPANGAPSRVATAPPVAGAPNQANSSQANSSRDSSAVPGASPSQINPGEINLGDIHFDDKKLEEARAEIVKAIDNGDEKALTSALLKLPAGTGSDGLLALFREYSWIGYLLLLYPLAIVLVDLVSTWARRRRNRASEYDRRFYGRQLRRSLLLTAVTAAAIGLLWQAGEHNFWWDQPTRFSSAVGLLILLGFMAWGLRVLKRRATARYSLSVIEDLRRQHLAMQMEINDLRKRVQSQRASEVASSGNALVK